MEELVESLQHLRQEAYTEMGPQYIYIYIYIYISIIYTRIEYSPY